MVDVNVLLLFHVKIDVEIAVLVRSYVLVLVDVYVEVGIEVEVGSLFRSTLRLMLMYLSWLT